VSNRPSLKGLRSVPYVLNFEGAWAAAALHRRLRWSGYERKRSVMLVRNRQRCHGVGGHLGFAL
jgi:hypothetical protein